MKTCLSGMPECKLGLNDRFMMDAQHRAPKGKPINLEDIRFHQKCDYVIQDRKNMLFAYELIRAVNLSDLSYKPNAP
ncbi:AP-1 complex subunit mu-1 [Artemisia annua]|uniref:AP-1 complex subunit mu-1 n=1 Tax=Artemisia annua TaxID=35608 RepID=A0A2U1L7B0_ARTAN|nr:AP-1 complex subunit mu-1 [Artemisia annua]